jgi:hypothetical protein
MLALMLVWVTATPGLLPLRAPSCAEPDSATRAALASALRSFSAAFLKADAEALDTFLVTDYLHTNGGTGTVLDKTRWLDYIRTRRAALQRGHLRVDRYELVGTAITSYPGTAIVSSQVVTEGLQNSIPFASRLQVTQVWVRTGERWRRAAFHDSPIPDS